MFVLKQYLERVKETVQTTQCKVLIYTESWRNSSFEQM